MSEMCAMGTGGMLFGYLFTLIVAGGLLALGYFFGRRVR